ncbi:hypothetical protein DFQ28_002892 [Apophysomyces sp. BC1034]|nr:hypothetical protein DFQ30_005660 [Apophysomyces sp. BC1015]KAG0179092.1 hypothetical protein DFQ29_002534 [Apophysomyces sp. BC1021]KAG0189792.1 hypothetical protein DFQ28_002892 [Apophysomyces sp. BC1034]
MSKELNNHSHDVTLDTSKEMVDIPENAITTTASSNTTDDEQPMFVLEGGIPANIPLETLAGPALVTAPDLDGRTLAEEFDWAGHDDDDDELDRKDKDEKKSRRRTLAQSGVFICLSENSSYIAWSCIVLFALILIAIDVAIFTVYNDRDHVTLVSYNLELWFTWLAFMWCIGFLSQLGVEFVPWAIKRLVGILRPHTTEVLRMRLSYYMALRSYIKLLLIAAWSWGSWSLIKERTPRPAETDVPYYVDVLYSILECFFFATLLVFIEKFILQLIVTSFHKKAYGDRISENDQALKILDKLKRVKRKTPQEFLLKRIRRKPKVPGAANGSPSRSGSLDDGHPDLGQQRLGGAKSIMASLQPRSKANVKFPTQNMDTLIPIPPLRSDEDEEEETKCQSPPHQVTARSNSADFIAHISRKLRSTKSDRNSFGSTTKSIDPQSPPATVVSPAARPAFSRASTGLTRTSQEIFGATREFGAVPGRFIKDGYKKFRAHPQTQSHSMSQQAKALAKRIYHNLTGPEATRDSVVEADLYPFFTTHGEAAEAFRLFDLDGNGDISKRELRSGCIRIYRERKNLARSMRDLSQATGKLDIILLVVFVAIWVIIVMAAFGVNVGVELMPLWSAFIAASFVFGSSAKDAFESIIFVFVTHPFDAGDRVFIQSENWIVHNVGLLVTTFKKWDGSIVYAKNSVLSTQYIINCRRTGRTGETVELHIHFSTPSWKIHRIRDHMREWCNEYPKLYTTNATSANIISFQNQNKITMTFYFEHTKNWQDADGRWLRHNNFMMELKEESERLEIQYVMPPQPLESKPNDAPPEIYNMGSKSSYGLEGLQQRRPYSHEQGQGQGQGNGAPSAPSNNVSGDAGAAAGAASTMMFASTM